MIDRGLELGLRVTVANVLPWNNGWPEAEAPIRELNALIEGMGVPVLPFHETLEDPERPGRMREDWTIEGDHPSVDGLPAAGRASLPPAMSTYGSRSMTQPLRRVLVRPPQAADAVRWREYGWRVGAEPRRGRGRARGAARDPRRRGRRGDRDGGRAGQPGRDLRLRPAARRRARRRPAAPGQGRAAGRAGGARGRSRRRPASRSPAASRRRERSTAATRSGSTGRRCSSAAATARTPPASSSSPPSSPTPRFSPTTCRTGTAAPR